MRRRIALGALRQLRPPLCQVATGVGVRGPAANSAQGRIDHPGKLAGRIGGSLDAAGNLFVVVDVMSEPPGNRATPEARRARTRQPSARRPLLIVPYPQLAQQFAGEDPLRGWGEATSRRLARCRRSPSTEMRVRTESE